MISEKIRFESQDLIVDGKLVSPDSGLAQAGVICVTGGGTEDCGSIYSEWQEYLVEEGGLASLAFNARGIGESEGAWRTDSYNYNSQTSPANSQASRVIDTIQATKYLTATLGTHANKIGIIGASMGGDIAVRSLVRLSPGALVLRAPAAYPNEVHGIQYGPEWKRRVQELGDSQASLNSSNFDILCRLRLPVMLVYSAGDVVIPRPIQEKYWRTVKLLGGHCLMVGDATTPHTYIKDRLDPNKDLQANEAARQITYRESTKLFINNLLKS
jgi:pimeloyl-ACP methyl ester carboxylesterase